MHFLGVKCEWNLGSWAPSTLFFIHVFLCCVETKVANPLILDPHELTCRTCLCQQSGSWFLVSDRWCWRSSLCPATAAGRCDATMRRGRRKRGGDDISKDARNEENETPKRREDGRGETKGRSDVESFLMAVSKGTRWDGKRSVKWACPYLTVTSSVNLSTRCVRMLRGRLPPPSCRWGGLLFRHAGRVELCTRNPAHRRGR